MKRKYLLSNGILGITLMFACQLCFAINDSIVKLSVEEIDNNILEHPKSVIWDEAENRLHTQKAILNWCLKN